MDVLLESARFKPQERARQTLDEQSALQWRPRGVPLAEATQRSLYKILRREHPTQDRTPTLVNLDCARFVAAENNGPFPPDEAIWRTTWSPNLTRKDQEFMWKLLHDGYKVGEYWRRMDDPEYNSRKYCWECGDDCESMRHILTECEESGQDTFWEEARKLWAHHNQGDWPKGDKFGVLLAAGLLRFEDDDGKRELGTERCFVILVATAWRCIWNARCKRVIPGPNGETRRRSTVEERRATWWKAINARFAQDQSATHKSYGKLAIKKDLHTVYEAEAVGIILGAHLLASEEQEFASEPSSISLDNQAVIRASEHQQRAQPGHGLLDIFRDQTERLLQVRDEGYSLSVRWVSGHDDAEFNEIIDEQAKLAAEGHESALAELPHVLRTRLKTSISAARQEYARRLDERWQQDWLMSPRYERHRHWAPNAASRKHIRATAGLSRLASSTLFQIRSGHAQLGAHLHRIGCLPSPTCEACGEADETVNHYLYDCPRWQDARQRMREAAGKIWRDRARMLSDEKGIVAILEFTKETGWGARGEKESEDGRPEGGSGEAQEDEEREVEQEKVDERGEEEEE
ncbi:unnamed protein product [Peniophora sp. CBMAI 1063]|nr:unnamed protein product [Peniophora sp. CBMAI 1063]